MGLIGNNFRLNTGVHRSLGEVIARTSGNANRYSSFCNTRSKDRATTVDAGVATPVGAYPSATYYPPQVAGQMAMRTTGIGSISASLVPSKSMSIDLTGSGDLTATGALVIAMLCAMTGSGTLTADIQGRANMELDLTGSGDLDATMTAFADMILELTGSGDLDATIAAYGDMSIDIVVTGTGLSTANVGQYVWEAILADFDANPDSAAAKLLGASSAGDPWATDLPGTYTADQAGALLLAYLKKIKGISSANL